MSNTVPAAVFTPDLLRRLDTSGPRYTSYPTADRFHEGFGEKQYREALAARAELARHNAAPPLAVYVHIPFCESVCYYCACNKIVTRHHERALPYLAMLEREIAMHAEALGPRQRVTQLHFGGGTPTFLSDAELSRVMGVVRGAFEIADDAECSIEVDPRTATPERLSHFWSLGLNRISFGVQDFDAEVQQAVHRIQPYEQVESLMTVARRLGYQSINVDLIYGLPKQRPDNFAHTIEQVIGLAPDRIALYGYAHLPERFKPQRRIVTAELPDGAARLAMLGHAIGAFGAAGYDYIGMDHFAKPDDPLAIAKRQGKLHRNFQGYTTQPECDMLGLGVSAIGRVGAVYAQNAKTIEGYENSLGAGRFATVRGLQLSADDLMRRSMIMDIMCRGRLDFAKVKAEFGVDMPTDFAAELARLEPLAGHGLVKVGTDAVEVTPVGWYVVRAVAMAFDRYIAAAAATRASFSKIV
ncbi:MAG: oxygen-independent coproporphyrinogen III oxidase [Aquincola sp.]|nr:oxygen-independent coproporphyrinogen III oxidase [Aquincola sp.]MDH4289221.1 oxygen-independent coproporphyrinogen III oxidase [Aquincola sp.]MDH5330145.1 oxygen-independent coproporphyrinogen III oxidase [Aquincola sp.]